MPPLTSTDRLDLTAKARALSGRPVVVKLGGSAMEDPAATRGTLEAVVALQAAGFKLVAEGDFPSDGDILQALALAARTR